MKLWLLRHGEAGALSRRDSDRELTAYGRQQVAEMAAQLKGQPLAGVVCSPYVRARQTTDIVLDVLNIESPPLIVPWLVPDEPVQTVVRQLDSLPEGDLLLVSHQPMLGLLGSWLCEGSLARPLPLGTASLACLEGDFAVAGLMRLQSLQHPQSGMIPAG